MSNNVKSDCHRTTSAICILTVIGVTFGFLYAMEYLTISDRKHCTKLEGFDMMLECSRLLSNELSMLYDNVENTSTQQPVIEDRSLQTQLCGIWHSYQNCTREILLNCGMEADKHFQNHFIIVPKCVLNETESSPTSSS